MPVCSGLTRLVRAGYSRHESGASRERARITRRAQDGSVHMQRSLPSSSYPARSTLKPVGADIFFFGITNSFLFSDNGPLPFGIMNPFSFSD